MRLLRAIWSAFWAFWMPKAYDGSGKRKERNTYEKPKKVSREIRKLLAWYFQECRPYNCDTAWLEYLRPDLHDTRILLERELGIKLAGEPLRIVKPVR